MACINPNTPEFKKALKETNGNPLLAELAVEGKYSVTGRSIDGWTEEKLMERWLEDEKEREYYRNKDEIRAQIYNDTGISSEELAYKLLEAEAEDREEEEIYRQKIEREAPALAAALKRIRAEENDTGLTKEELEEKLMEAAMEDEEERAYQRWKDKVWEQRNVANDTGLTKEELEDKLMEVRAEEEEEAEYYRLKAEIELPILRQVKKRLGLFGTFDESSEQLRKQQEEDERREDEEDNNCTDSPFLD